MGEGKSQQSSFTVVAYSWMQFVFDWSIVCLVLLSMTVQLILVLGGAIRYRTASRLMNLVVWICYMGADFVATSALGTMINVSTKRVYAIWASMLMIHLGGPDTITAYSVPDSNLWKRHCFSMLYQGLIAAYVVYVSAVEGRAEMEWYLLGAAFLIFVVGITKYGERTWALWLASPPQIVSSVQPISNYMKIEHALGLDIDESIPDDEIADVDRFRELHEYKVEYDVDDDEYNVHYQYIVAGEECFDEDDDNGDWSENVVTIKDVWEHEGGVATDNYLLCVSHALFKMYKRRFASLRFHEALLQKTRRFFLGWRFDEIKIFSIAEIELKFLYDYLFSKSSGTAFSGWGVGMRVVNISLLGVCWFLIMRGLQEAEDVLHGQRTVTYILMCVALGLEGFQLGRIILSDWSMVWLICANIRLSRKISERWWGSCSATLIQGVAKVVGRARKEIRKVVGGKYWQNQIPQLCVLETCFSARSYSSPLIRKLLASHFLRRWYVTAVTAWHAKRESVDDHSKYTVVRYFKKQERTNPRDLLSGMSIGAIEEKGLGWEHLLLGAHVAITIEEKLEDESNIEDEEEKKFCVRMSRYFGNLLVTCPEILPVDLENAKRVYREVFWEIQGKMGEMGENATLSDFCRYFTDSNWGETASPTLRLAKRSVGEGRVDWDDMAEIWSTLLCMCGVYDKRGEHGERVTRGGEFLTVVWALMGHLGIGEEWYSATALKTDPYLFSE